jgi:hypothetical protein
MVEAAIGSYDQQYLNALKFEMGTGKDSATQAANQVLLTNDNQTLISAQADHEMEFQNRFSMLHALNLANENYTTTMDTLTVGPVNIETYAAKAAVLATVNVPYARNIFSSKTPYLSPKDWAFPSFKTTSMGLIDTALFRVIQPAAIGTGAFQFGVGVGSLGVGVYKEVKGDK